VRSIKVNISGREYPLNVSEESVSAMQKAASLVNEQTTKYSSAYPVSDQRDLLAMCALQLAFQRLEDDNKLEAIEKLLNITD